MCVVAGGGGGGVQCLVYVEGCFSLFIFTVNSRCPFLEAWLRSLYVQNAYNAVSDPSMNYCSFLSR